MPIYEYYCAKCTSKFELLRSMSRSDDPARCPNGHAGAVRTLSMFATAGKASAEFDAPMQSGGGCGCGGGACGCGH